MPQNAVKASMWKKGRESLQLITVMSSFHNSGHREPCKQTSHGQKDFGTYEMDSGGSSVGKEAYYASVKTRVRILGTHVSGRKIMVSHHTV